MDLTPLIIASVITIFGGLLALKGLFRLLGRPISGSMTTLAGSSLVIVGIITLGSAINIASYTRLTAERPLAKIVFYQSAPQQFTARLTTFDKDNDEAGAEPTSQQFLLKGDEWRLEGKMIKWQGYGSLLGLDTLFKFDRLSGRYQDPAKERDAVRTLYQLSAQPGLDLWKRAQEIPFMIHFIDARYGTGTYLPMRDKAEYIISVGQTGLIARPNNEFGKSAVDDWF